MIIVTETERYHAVLYWEYPLEVKWLILLRKHETNIIEFQFEANDG